MKMSVRHCVSLLTVAYCVVSSASARAGQTINADFPDSCVNQGGAIGATNIVTDFDNGTFGTESGAPDQTPDVDPYPSTITGGIFDNFYDINHGDYAYVANPVTPRNRFQHINVTDPVYGNTGRFFASDPNANTPTMNFQITNVVPNENYELSFWAVNSEFNAIPNRVNAVVDGIVSFSTGLLVSNPTALPWQKYGFVFNSGDRTTIQLSMASTETGAGGRDFYLDNVEMRICTLSLPGVISGRIFSDTNSNDVFDSANDGTINQIEVQLFDTQGTTTTTDDIYISSVSSGAGGIYEFSNLAANPDYELRVVTTDPDLPTGASAGTSLALSTPLVSGGNLTGQDFGFDLSNAKLEATKTVQTVDPTAYSIPGEDVAYTIEVFNRGTGDADDDSLFLVDNLPPDVIFRNDFFDATEPDPVKFEQNSAGLDWDYSRDVAFATAGPPPANFAACDYTPNSTYDADVRYICFAPDGAMQGGSPSPSFAVSFRTQIK